MFRFFFATAREMDLALGDPHPGNLMRNKADGRLVALDFGLVRSLERGYVDREARIYRALDAQDAAAIAASFRELGYLNGAVDEQLLKRYMLLTGEWMWDVEQPFRLSGDYAADLAGRAMGLGPEWLTMVRGFDVPPEALLLRRMENMVFSTLCDLRAAADWQGSPRSCGQGWAPDAARPRARRLARGRALEPRRASCPMAAGSPRRGSAGRVAPVQRDVVGEHLDVALGQRDGVLRVARLGADERVDPLHGAQCRPGDERVVAVAGRGLRARSACGGCARVPRSPRSGARSCASPSARRLPPPRTRSRRSRRRSACRCRPAVSRRGCSTRRSARSARPRPMLRRPPPRRTRTAPRAGGGSRACRTWDAGRGARRSTARIPRARAPAVGDEDVLDDLRPAAGTAHAGREPVVHRRGLLARHEEHVREALVPHRRGEDQPLGQVEAAPEKPHEPVSR